MSADYEIRKSPIHGSGVFAKTELASGQVVTPVAVEVGGPYPGVVFPQGRFYNHSSKPNGAMRETEPHVWVYVTSRRVLPGEELTMNYYDTPFWILKPEVLGFKG